MTWSLAADENIVDAQKMEQEMVLYKIKIQGIRNRMQSYHP